MARRSNVTGCSPVKVSSLSRMTGTRPKESSSEAPSIDSFKGSAYYSEYSSKYKNTDNENGESEDERVHFVPRASSDEAVQSLPFSMKHVEQIQPRVFMLNLILIVFVIFFCVITLHFIFTRSGSSFELGVCLEERTKMRRDISNLREQVFFFNKSHAIIENNCRLRLEHLYGLCINDTKEMSCKNAIKEMLQ